MNEGWKDYVNLRLTPKDRDKLLMILLDFHMNDYDSIIGYSKFEKSEYPDEPDIQEMIYWTSCGENLLS